MEPQTVTPQKARPMSASRATQQVAMRQVGPQGLHAEQWRTTADVHCRLGCRCSSGTIRPALHAELCLAKLCSVSELCRRDLPEAVFTDGMALYRPILSLSQVPLGWRKVSLEWSDGWWFLDFKDQPSSCWQR